ncbi:MAG: type II CAAX endopeptidase family protein [Bacillota bacterium]|nr:type II CAAX endopeptidase family protein [Bacillota bacterium]
MTHVSTSPQTGRSYGLHALTMDLSAYLLSIVIGSALWATAFPSVGLWGSHVAQLSAALLLLRVAGLGAGFRVGKPGRARAIGLTLVAGLPFCVIGMTEKLISARWAMVHAPEQVSAFLSELRTISGFGLFVQAAYFLILIPVAEEVAFRGYFHARLRSALPGSFRLGRLRLTRGAVASGALFSAFHMVNWVFGKQAPSLWLCLVGHAGQFAFGVAAAYLYDETGSLWPPTVIHSVVNALTQLTVPLFLLMLARSGIPG